MKRRTRLLFEALEDRTVPSTFTILNLADSGDGSLRQAVLDANASPGADTIRFAYDLTGTIALTGGQLGITGDLTIDGPGGDRVSVSGNHMSRVFFVHTGTNVAIDDLTIAGGRVSGSTADGGGVLNNGNLRLDRVTLSDNQAIITNSTQARGGAVANLSGATLTVIDSVFTNNWALGGLVGGTGNGGGIFNLTGRLTVTGSTFAGNHTVGGSGGGGALGGGITSMTGSTATISDCTFVGNQAVAGDGGTGVGFGRGGGIVNFASVMTVTNCRILDNVARGGSGLTRLAPRVGFASAGGIFSADAATLSLSGTVVRGNLAIGGSNNTCTGGNGFVGNAQGGGMTNVGTATVADCLFEDNEARGGNDNRGDGVGHQYVGTGFGGGIASTAGDPTGNPTRLTLQNVTVRHNRAVGGNANTAGTFANAGIGGGIASNGSNNNASLSSGTTAIILDCTVAHNQAIGGRDGASLGGGVANQLGGVTNISGTTLSHNRALSCEGGNGMGGGIYNGSVSNHPSNVGVPTILTVDNSEVLFNSAIAGSGGDGQGGGFWNGGITYVSDCVVSNNRAIGCEVGDGFGGGAFNAAGALLRFERCTVSKNHANGGDNGIGGGVFSLGTLSLDISTRIFRNHGSTSHDDLFELFG